MSHPKQIPFDEASRRELAHDIRNSIGAMQNATELLDRHYRPEGREERLFGVLRTELRRLREMTDERICPPRKG